MIKYLKERVNNPFETTKRALIGGILVPYDAAFIGTLENARKHFPEEDWNYQGQTTVLFINGVRNFCDNAVHCFLRNY